MDCSSPRRRTIHVAKVGLQTLRRGEHWGTLGASRTMSAPMLIRVLLVISEPKLRARLRKHLQRSHLLVTPVAGEEVLRRLTSESYDLALLDRLPAGVDSLSALVERVGRLPDRPELVVVGARDDVERRAELLAAGSIAVLERALTEEALDAALSTLIERRRRLRLERLAAAGPQRFEDPRNLVAESPGMRRVVTTAERVAMTSSPVLLLGETGVGKERVAQLIHNTGPWARGPFVAVNCAAIPSELFESELFGHERGSFTGATRARRGRFELADQGTLFLDEVGEVPLHLQAKLLRVLQQRMIEPVGSERSVVVNVRVIAATNRNLRKEAEAGRFRSDLYYRLGVVEIEIPPLRERPEDIEPLIDSFTEVLGRQFGGIAPPIDPEVLTALKRYSWPGNVRELVNVLERAMLLCGDAGIGLGELPATVAACSNAPLILQNAHTNSVGEDEFCLPDQWLDRPWKQVREQLLAAGERAYLVGLLTRCGGRIGLTAKTMGIAPRSLFEKMRKHGLRKEDFRS